MLYGSLFVSCIQKYELNWQTSFSIEMNKAFEPGANNLIKSFLTQGDSAPLKV